VGATKNRNRGKLGKLEQLGKPEHPEHLVLLEHLEHQVHQVLQPPHQINIRHWTSGYIVTCGYTPTIFEYEDSMSV
jgi:hypothetical protein